MGIAIKFTTITLTLALLGAGCDTKEKPAPGATPGGAPAPAVPKPASQEQAKQKPGPGTRTMPSTGISVTFPQNWTIEDQKSGELAGWKAIQPGYPKNSILFQTLGFAYGDIKIAYAEPAKMIRKILNLPETVEVKTSESELGGKKAIAFDTGGKRAIMKGRLTLEEPYVFCGVLAEREGALDAALSAFEGTISSINFQELKGDIIKEKNFRFRIFPGAKRFEKEGAVTYAKLSRPDIQFGALEVKMDAKANEDFAKIAQYYRKNKSEITIDESKEILGFMIAVAKGLTGTKFQKPGVSAQIINDYVTLEVRGSIEIPSLTAPGGTETAKMQMNFLMEEPYGAYFWVVPREEDFDLIPQRAEKEIIQPILDSLEVLRP